MSLFSRSRLGSCGSLDSDDDFLIWKPQPPPIRISKPNVNKMQQEQECFLRFDLFPGAELTKREAAYLEYNVIHFRMANTLTELSVRTGMPITQENGQRRYGPPVNYNGPPPQKGSEIFVGKLPRDIFEADLVPVFEKAGNIFELRLMMDFSGTNRGYCFVQFYTADEAAHAIEILNNYEIRTGRFIGVVKSVDNCRLFVGGIPRDKSKEEILSEIRKITEGVVRVISNPSPIDRTKNRGYAFIEYENHRTAAMARRKLIPGKIQMFGTNIAVDWAEPEPEVQNLYVRNLMPTTTEEDIREIFNLHSRQGVEKVKKIKDYAFVHFMSRSQAEEALRTLDGTEIDGSEVEITWAKPVNKVAYKARKALAKQLYSHDGNRGKVKDGLSTSERIFGQYNNLSYSSGPQMIYQMPQSPYHGGETGPHSYVPLHEMLPSSARVLGQYSNLSYGGHPMLYPSPFHSEGGPHPHFVYPAGQMIHL